MSLVKYATGFVKLSMDEFCQPVRPTIGTPVITLSDLTEVVEGLTPPLGNSPDYVWGYGDALRAVRARLEAQGKEGE